MADLKEFTMTVDEYGIIKGGLEEVKIPHSGQVDSGQQSHKPLIEPGHYKCAIDSDGVIVWLTPMDKYRTMRLMPVMVAGRNVLVAVPA